MAIEEFAPACRRQRGAWIERFERRIEQRRVEERRQFLAEHLAADLGGMRRLAEDIGQAAADCREHGVDLRRQRPWIAPRFGLVSKQIGEPLRREVGRLHFPYDLDE